MNVESSARGVSHRARKLGPGRRLPAVPNWLWSTRGRTAWLAALGLALSATPAQSLPLPRVSPSAFVLPMVLPAADSSAAPQTIVPRGAFDVGADKFQHASLSAVFGIGAGIVTRSNVAALLTPLALGLAKELRDQRHTRFDPADLAADAVGALVAVGVTSTLLR